MTRNSLFRPAVAVAALLLCSRAEAQVQSPAQQACLATVAKSLALAVKTNGGVIASCVKLNAAGKLPSGQSADDCLVADNAGKIDKVEDKVAGLDAAKCAAAPDYGYLAPAALMTAAGRESRAHIRDVFGQNVEAALLETATDKRGAICQATATKAANKLLSQALAIVAACEKAAFKAGTIDDATDFAGCVGHLALDPGGKLAKAAAKAAIKIDKKCSSVAQPTAFPGECAAAPEFTACLLDSAVCRACLAANEGDGAVADCDAIDNGAADGSCCPDADGDGSTACEPAPDDCDDDDPTMYPGAEEVCDGVDNDCNLDADDFPVDVGESCGSSDVAPCSTGTAQCISGALQCTGAVEPLAETCNDLDDDCDGSTDTGLAAAQCRVPAEPPVGATSACTAGTLSCTGGVPACIGATGPSSTLDTCGVDANCDGQLTGQPDLQTDAFNCGACGNVCGASSAHSRWTCVAGTCQFEGCDFGYQDNDADQSCETPCTFVSAQEACNGIDDDCDGSIDEDVVAPATYQVCGTSPFASANECTSGVTVSCAGGSWSCTFPAGVCAGGCSPDDEVCDALDNDCDGHVNENVPGFGYACASDDGLPAPGHGPCRTTGTMICSGANAIQCSAQKENCANLPGGCTELCDGVDNDCDGLVDETYQFKGLDPLHFVKPTVTKLGVATWMYSYEASRPSATATSAGAGNGYQTSAPSGTPLDKTKACSKPSVLPWFNVTPTEAEQTCAAMGGSLCTTAQYQSACKPNAVACTYGYNPRGLASCASSYTGSKFCNLGLSFDFDAATGDQDGLLSTGSSSLQNCWADWSNLQSNTASTNRIYDLTGNLREITKDTPVWRLMGGAFNNDAEEGASCNFTFYAVNNTFQFYDTGFRCCFTSDPTL